MDPHDEQAALIVDNFLNYQGEGDLQALKDMIATALRHAYERGRRSRGSEPAA